MGRVELTEENYKQIWVPSSLTHGFVVLPDSADYLYKTTNH